MKNYVSHGSVMTFIASAALASGEGFLLGGNVFAVSAYDVKSGEEGEAHVEGVYLLPKTAANAPAAFAKAYWDDTAKAVTTTATANTMIGLFAKAYGAGTTVAEVKLIPSLV